MDRLIPVPACKCSNYTCGITQQMQNIVAWTLLLQFLMGLNPEFDIVWSQILSLDPLPKVSKAFSMVASAESQKAMSLTYSASSHDANALFVKSASSKFDDRKPSFKKRNVGKKSNKHCDHRKVDGHTSDTCFKLHGHPDWYKEYKESRKNGPAKKFVVNFAATPDDDGAAVTDSRNDEFSAIFSTFFKQEIGKYI